MPKKIEESGYKKDIEKKINIKPPMPKGKQLKKIIKEKTLKYKPTKPLKKIKLNKPKNIKRVTEIKKPKNRDTIKKKLISLHQEKIIKKDPMAWMYEDKAINEKVKSKKQFSKGGNISQDIKELYGDTFGKLTPGQQQYIIDNQEIMRRITQEVLTRVAQVNLPRNLNVNKNNVIEFYLHPNGDMTDFRFLSSSGYFILDDTTKETIEYSYSRYPRPTEKTLVRYNVYYHLARY